MLSYHDCKKKVKGHWGVTHLYTVIGGGNIKGVVLSIFLVSLKYNVNGCWISLGHYCILCSVFCTPLGYLFTVSISSSRTLSTYSGVL